VVDAVLFDWGHTLMDWVPEPELLEAGHRAGLEALDRDDLPELDLVSARFRDMYLPSLEAAVDTVDEVEYPLLVRRLLADVGVAVDDDELDRFLDAEHAAWMPARRLGAHTHALLESLRARGLRLGLVSNAFDPGWLLQRDLEGMGVAERLDVAVFSSEVGKRKPHPLIFERALDELDVDAARSLFVGDSLYHDVGGAARLGMTTVQALWFRADERADDAEPDFQAFTPMDVLNVVRRVNGEV
jgi:HAD superfamily hydrolase (TIGR01509 family)